MISSFSYLEVAIALPVYKTYIYSVPESLSEMASAGKRVLVPFGQRRVTGYILGSSGDADQDEIKNVLDILDEKPLFPSSMIPFFKWTADYYMHPIGDVIKSALPGGLNFYDFVTIEITEEGEETLFKDSVTPLEGEILKLLKTGSFRYKELCKNLNKHIPNALIYDMERRGLIVHKRKLKGGTTRPKTVRHVSFAGSDIPTDGLSDSKKKIIDTLKNQGEISISKLKELIPSAPRLIKSLEAAG